MTSPARPWRGEIFLDPQGGFFRGVAGDNEMHAHGAHQVSIGLDGLVTVSTPDASVRGRAISIAASCRHCLAAGAVVAIYADVSSDLGLALVAQARGEISVLSEDLAAQLVAIGQRAGRLDRNLARDLAGVFGESLTGRRGESLPAGLRAALRSSDRLSRADLARQVGLSEGRFSHWFRERTGLPMRTYRKWQRLTVAVEQILDGEPMASAAICAGFADQAHFVRTFRAMFGINPVGALGRPRRT